MSSPSIAEARSHPYSATSAQLDATRDRADGPLLRYLLGAVLLLGAAIRLYCAARLPFDQDELYTIIEASRPFAVRLGHGPGIEGRPLYYLLQYPLLGILPDTPFALRLLPTLFGLAGLWATYLLVRELLGRRAGVVATALLAISPWHIDVSGMVRYWSLVYLLSTLTFLFLYRAYRDDRPRDYLKAFVVLLLGSASHPTFLFPAAGATLGVTLAGSGDRLVGWRWPTRRAWQYLWGPYLGFLVAAFVALKLFAPAAALRNASGRGLLSTLRLVPAMIEGVSVLLFGLALIGAFVLVASRERRLRTAGHMVLAGVVACLVLLVGLSFTTDVYAVYATSMLPLVVLAATAAIDGVAALTGAMAGRVALLATTVIGLAIFPQTASHMSDGTRFDYRPAFARIRRDAPQETVLTWPIALQRRYAPELKGVELLPDTTRLSAVLERDGRAWAVVSMKRYGIAMDDEGALAAWLIARCRAVESYQRPRFDYRLHRVDLYHCSRD